MNTSIVSEIQKQLGPDAVESIGRQLGADTQTTSNAIGMALPMLLGGLAKNASNPQGASSLNSALSAHDGSILDNLGGG